jgi:ApaG protein
LPRLHRGDSPISPTGSSRPTVDLDPSVRGVPGCIGSEAVTHSIRVRVEPSFVPEQSDPHERKFLFNYRIRVVNEGERAVQLVGRHWVIVDAHGRREEVAGEGVVGRQPALQPGQTFSYESFCPLTTHWGTMEGTYQFRDLGTGELFNVEVKRFHLVMPPQPVVAARQTTGAGGA